MRIPKLKGNQEKIDSNVRMPFRHWLYQACHLQLPEKLENVQRRRNWGGGQKGQLPPLPFAGRGKGGKSAFKYKKYYITVSFQGAFS